MAWFGRGKRADLLELCKEFGVVEANEESTIPEMKSLITKSEDFEEEFTKEVFKRIVAERVKREEIEARELDREVREKKSELEHRKRLQVMDIKHRERLKIMEIEACDEVLEKKKLDLEAVKKETKLDLEAEEEKFEFEVRKLEIEEKEKHRAFELEKPKFENQGKRGPNSSTDTISEVTIKSSIDLGCDVQSFDLKESVAKKLNLGYTPIRNDLYSFGSLSNPVTQTIGECVIDFQIDDVIAKDVPVFIVADTMQPVDLILGRSFLDLPHLAYARVRDTLHFGYAKDYPFSNLDKGLVLIPEKDPKSKSGEEDPGSKVKMKDPESKSGEEDPGSKVKKKDPEYKSGEEDLGSKVKKKDPESKSGEEDPGSKVKMKEHEYKSGKEDPGSTVKKDEPESKPGTGKSGSESESPKASSDSSSKESGTNQKSTKSKTPVKSDLPAGVSSDTEEHLSETTDSGRFSEKGKEIRYRKVKMKDHTTTAHVSQLKPLRDDDDDDDEDGNDDDEEDDSDMLDQKDS